MSITSPNTKQQIKIYLIIASACLSIILAFLLIFGLLVVRPRELNEAVQLGQYIYVDLNNLQKTSDTIEADYIGKHIVQNKPNDVDINQYKIVKQPVRPRIAIIITNLGLNKNPTQRALAMPKEIGLGFVPYTSKLKPLLYQALENGHEIYLYIPFETSEKFDNPGKHALRTDLSAKDNAARLTAILKSQDKYIGVYSSYKEKFSDDQAAINLVLDEIKSRGLIFVFGKGNSSQSFQYLKNSERTVITNVLIDEVTDPVLIRHNLKKLSQEAKEFGFAVGYSQGYTITMDIINEWLLTLKSQGIELVPISQLAEASNL